MFEATFEHYGMWFGIVCDDWGDCRGAKSAAAELDRQVRELNSPRVRAWHSALVKSDAACADDPIFDSPEMSDLYQACLAARNAGMEVSDGHLNKEHHCILQLVPFVDQP
jgi:hypothetical protein